MARAFIALAALALTVHGCALGGRVRVDDGASAEAAITAESLAATIRFLADDLFEGRGPGTRGDVLARRYVASEMEAVGLRPGADGAWEQSMELLGLTAQLPPIWTFTGTGKQARLAAVSDFVASTGIAGESAAITDSGLVFVGYGIQAAEFDWDDFKGVDLRGKTLLVMNNDPDWDADLFAGKRRLYYGRWTYKYESAARQGATAVIVIHTTESAGYPWQTVQTSWTGENSRLPGAGAPRAAIEAWITEAAAREIVGLAGHSLDDLVARARRRDFKPVDLGVTTSLAVRNRMRRYSTANVIGVLPGSDPTLAAQAIVYTAHHDHLGIKVGPDGHGVVYNGALDNASGVAQLLSIARAFTAAPPPKRSVVFLAVAAEEQGLLGSEYYVAHPTVPPAKIVANINFDGANIWGRTRDVAVVGYGKSTMDQWAAAAAERQGRTLVGERFPDRGMFYRSDQFSFARAGIPVLYARSGVDVIDRPAGWGREQIDAWVSKHYHQPSDDFDPSWNLDGAVEDAQLAFEVGYALAQSDEMPSWTPGDEFEAVRRKQ